MKDKARQRKAPAMRPDYPFFRRETWQSGRVRTGGVDCASAKLNAEVIVVTGSEPVKFINSAKSFLPV